MRTVLDFEIAIMVDSLLLGAKQGGWWLPCIKRSVNTLLSHTFRLANDQLGEATRIFTPPTHPLLIVLLRCTLPLVLL